MKKNQNGKDTIEDWRRRGLWTQDQLAESLGVSRATVDEWKKEGMPHIKKGRFVFIFQSDFLSWMKQNLCQQTRKGGEIGE